MGSNNKTMSILNKKNILIALVTLAVIAGGSVGYMKMNAVDDSAAYEEEETSAVQIPVE